MLLIVKNIAAVTCAWVKKGNPINFPDGLCGWIITIDGGRVETDLDYLRLEAAVKLALENGAKTINTLNLQELKDR